MAYGMNIVTAQPAAVTSKLESQGIPCTVWNLGGITSGPVKVELGFESQADLDAAKSILALEPALA
jgi:hypothetical protein